MNTGTVALIPFRLTGAQDVKVRPAVVLSTTGKHHDVVVCIISSVVPQQLGTFDILIQPNPGNNLRTPSVIKVDSILQLKEEDIITILGTISDAEIVQLIDQFKKLVD